MYAYEIGINILGWMVLVGMIIAWYHNLGECAGAAYHTATHHHHVAMQHKVWVDIAMQHNMLRCNIVWGICVAAQH
jgi:hypothetical protein